MIVPHVEQHFAIDRHDEAIASFFDGHAMFCP